MRGSLLKVISAPSPPRAGDLPELVRHQRVAADERDVHPLLLGLAQDQPGFGMVAAHVDDFDVVLLEAGYHGVVVPLARGIGAVEGFLLAGGVQRLLRLIRQAFAVGGVVMQDGDALAAEILRHVGAGHLALLVVPAANSEGVPAAVVGIGRVGRGGADLQHAFLRIHLAGRDGAAGTVVPGHEGDLPAGKLVGDRDRLARVAGVVADLEHKLAAEHAATGVDVRHRLLGTGPHLGAEHRVLAGHRASRGDGFHG